MRFDLTDLDPARHVVEAGSITHGAQRAHLAPAAASTRIHHMGGGRGVNRNRLLPISAIHDFGQVGNVRLGLRRAGWGMPQAAGAESAEMPKNATKVRILA